jgi:hypothetical protein
MELKKSNATNGFQDKILILSYENEITDLKRQNKRLTIGCVTVTISAVCLGTTLIVLLARQ